MCIIISISAFAHCVDVKTHKRQDSWRAIREEAWCSLEEVMSAAAFRGDNTLDAALLFPAASWIWLPASCLWLYEHDIRPLTGFTWQISASGRNRTDYNQLIFSSSCQTSRIGAQVRSGSTVALRAQYTAHWENTELVHWHSDLTPNPSIVPRLVEHVTDLLICGL